MDPDLDAMMLVQSGDEAGLVELMDRHKDLLFRFLVRYTGNPTDAEDLTEETFVRVYLNAHKYKPVAKVKTWMYAIAANLAKDQFRKKRRGPKVVSLQENYRGASGQLYQDVIAEGRISPAEDVGAAEYLTTVMREVERLPHKLKVPLVFCVLEGHSHEECAELTNSTIKAIETRIYRARRRLLKKCQK